MDRERNEDLNPHGDDIEEKVRRMLDLSVPDESDAPATPPPKKPAKPVPVAPKSAAPKDATSAPTVKSAPTVTPTPKESNSVSIAVEHHEKAVPADKTIDEPKPKEPVVAPIKKITITDHDETPADVAEKLNEAIAELDEPAPKKAIPKDKPEKKKDKTSETVTSEGEDDEPKVPAEPVEDRATAPPLPPADKSAVTAKAGSATKPEPKSNVEPAQSDEPEETDQSDEPNEPDEAEKPQADIKPAEAEDSESKKEELEQAAAITVGEAIDQAANEVDVNDPAVLKDPATDKAVDDIVASESDEILEIEDAIRDTDEPIKPATSVKTAAKPPKTKEKKRSIFKSRALRWILLLLILGAILALAGMPKTRYFILNSAGVRAESSLTVLDDSTQQPLKNVQVSIGDATGTTNAQGEVTISKVKLGTNLLTIQKRAFAPVSKTVVIGWGSNPLQSYELTPTGTQYEFTTVDYLSGKPIAKVEASSLGGDAISNEQGIIKLTLDKPADDTQLTVTFKRDGYRDETLSLSANDKINHTVKLVPSEKNLFVSKRSGKYDVYSMYVDGKDEKVVLAGMGTERDDMVLVPHPTEPVAAYVSTRGGKHNNQGYLLSTLTIINTDDNTTHDVVAAERIQLIDWSGDNLVYVQIASGESASSPKRYRLMSYNQKTTATKELAASNYFNDVVSVGGDIYYAPSSAYQSNKTALYKVKADGSGASTVFSQEVWNILRTSYDHLALAVEQQWYDYQLGDKQPQKLNAAPSSQQPRVYINSPDGKQAAWVDVRDGKGVLLVYDVSSKNDTVIDTKSGLTYPVRWLNNTTLVYRVKNDQETADYVVSLNGGKPVKVRDVTNAGGIDRWYYY